MNASFPPFLILILASLIPYLIKLILAGIFYLFVEKEYKDIVNAMFEKLSDNEEFIYSAAKIISSNPYFGVELIEKIEELPSVQKLAGEEDEKGMKDLDKEPSLKKIKRAAGSGRSMVAWEFAKAFWRSFNDPKLQNTLIRKVGDQVKLLISPYKVDLFIVFHSRYFENHNIPYIRHRLNNLDDSKWSVINSIPFKHPQTSLNLSILLGIFGIDRFYIGDYGIGIVKLLTFGGLGIWVIIDWFMIQRSTRKKNFIKLQKCI